MKMKELEQRTGIGREAIRFYIREGLLPEPERPKRNVARYNETHVIRLKAIKRLQEERFLPLAVIKALLAADDGVEAIDAQAFPALDVLLQERLGPGLLGDACVLLSDLLDETGFRAEQVEDMARVGVIDIRRDGGRAYVDLRDASIIRTWAQLHAVGFTEERGFTADTAHIYVEFVEWLTKAEVKLFYEHLADKLSVEEAARIGERGITLINDIIGQMRTRAILAELKTLNDNRGNDAITTARSIQE